jgi:hypothetical protein
LNKKPFVLIALAVLTGSYLADFDAFKSMLEIALRRL